MRVLLNYWDQRMRDIPRAALSALTLRLPVSVRTQLVYSLERSPQTLELDLDHLSPSRFELVTASHVVAEAESLVIPSSPPIGLADGHYWNALRVHRLRNVTVDPSSGLVFAGDRVISQSTYGWRRASDAAFLSSAGARASRPLEISPVAGPVAPLGGSVSNYYFFLINALPRILHTLAIEPKSTAIFADPIPTYVHTALNELRIPYVIVEPKAFRHNDVLLCDPSRHPWPHPANIRMLRDLATQYSAKEKQYPSKIYISRRGSGRQLHDEEKLEAFLDHRGYSSVQLELLPWSEQIAMLWHAESVIAAHGAGLANVAFMQVGARVFELTVGTWWYPSMRNIAEIAQLHHKILHLPFEAEYPHGTSESAIAALRCHL